MHWHGSLKMVFHGIVHETVKVAGVPSCHTCSTNHILKNQIPANHEGGEFPHSDIAVHIRASRSRHPGAKLGIAESREGGGSSRNEEGENNCWPRSVFGHPT